MPSVRREQRIASLQLRIKLIRMLRLLYVQRAIAETGATLEAAEHFAYDELMRQGLL